MRSLFIICFFFTGFIGQLKAQEERELYLWNTCAVNVGLAKKMNLKISTKTHYQVNNELRDMSYVDLNLSRQMTKWLKLGVAFRGAQLNSVDSEMYEYRPQSYLNFSVVKNQIKYQTTNRIEYRFFDKQDGHFRYYHNVFVDFPSLFGFLPKTYVGEEVFTKLNGEGVHLGRIYGGVHVWKNDWFGLDMFYVWQKLKRQDWATADALGLNMIFSI